MRRCRGDVATKTAFWLLFAVSRCFASRPPTFDMQATAPEKASSRASQPHLSFAKTHGQLWICGCSWRGAPIPWHFLHSQVSILDPAGVHLSGIASSNPNTCIDHGCANKERGHFARSHCVFSAGLPTDSFPSAPSPCGEAAPKTGV
jgi:hypothetical protein